MRSPTPGTAGTAAATAAIPDEEAIDPEWQRRTIYETFVAWRFLDDVVGPISGHRSHGW